MKLIEYLVYEEPTYFTKEDVRRRISDYACKRVIPELLKLGIIVQLLRIGRVDVYSVNKDSEIFKCLVRVKNDLEKIIGEGGEDR